MVQGRLFRNSEGFGKMDAFVLLTHKGKNFKAAAKGEGAMNPVWNSDVFSLPIGSPSEEVLVRCYDKRMIRDDFVGEATFTVSELLKNPTTGRRS